MRLFPRRFFAAAGLAAVVLSVAVFEAPAPARAAASAKTVVDQAPGVKRVIIWDGVTPKFLGALAELTPYARVFDYEIIDGVAVAVPEQAVPDVIAFSRGRGLKAIADRIVKANLTNSTKTIHVKGAGQAWESGYTGQGVSIAVLDTGIDGAHAGFNDLDDNPATNDPKIVAFRNCTVAGCPAVAAFDDNGHGSHASGIAAGTGEGSSGDGPRNHAHVGVAYEANLVGMKVLNNAGSGSSTNIIAAINWVAQNRNIVTPPIRVMSMSFGTLVNTGGNDGTDPEDVAIDNATALGLVSAIAAGNGSCDGACPNVQDGNVGIPGDAKTAITVCSSNSAVPPAQPAFTTWDSEGPTADGRIKPDVCAPGESVQSVDSGTGTGYFAQGGTSMSTPHVAGIAALIIQAVPSITPAQLKDVLARTASHYDPNDNVVVAGEVRHGKNNDRGWGEAYAKEAIALAIQLYGGGPQPLVAHANGPYYVAAGEKKTLTASASGGLPGFTYSWDLDGNGVFGDASGQSVTLTAPATPGTRTVRVQVTDSSTPTAKTATDSADVQVLAPLSVFTDDVESGANGWSAASSGAPSAAGWHRESFKSQSPSNAWYVGNDATQVYTSGENVTLTRTFDFGTGSAATSGQLLFKFAMSGTLETTFDFLHVNIRETGSSSYTELAKYDDTTVGAWSIKTHDITAYKGKQADIQLQWTSDDFNPPDHAADTGPFVDDMSVVGTEAPVTDSTPPAAITDLAATGGSSVALTWTAVGDDGTSGTASSYDLRRSTSPITGANFAIATPVSIPAPQASGTPEGFTVTGLAPGTTYYFAIKAIDDASNAGAISNVVSAATDPDTTPPSQVTGLAASPGNAKVTLTWNAATDNVGVDHYVVSQDGVDVSSPAGTGATITGLVNGTTYSFRVRAVDTAGNNGPDSSSVSATPTAPPAEVWPQFRRTATRTGLSAQSGTIGAPSILQTISVGGSASSSPLIVDLDGDNANELLTVSEQAQPATTSSVRAYRRSPSGLTLMWSFTVPAGPTNSATQYVTLATGDLNQDGKPEVAVYSNSQANTPATSSTFFNGRLNVLNGQTGVPIAGVDTTSLDIALHTSPAIGDVTGDGKPEIVVNRFQSTTSPSGTGYYVAAFDLVGSSLTRLFDTRVSATQPSLAPASPAIAEIRSVHAGLEIVLGEEPSGQPGNTSGRVYVCSPTATAANCSESIATTTGIRGVSVADLDDDGSPEIVANGRTGSSLNVIKTSPSLSRVSQADGFLGNTASLGDVTGDGKLEIVNINYSEFVDDTAKIGNVTVRGFTGSAIVNKGTLSRPAASGRSTQAPGGGALVNIIGDARPELVFGSGDSNLVAVRISQSGTPTALWSLSLGGNPTSATAAGDLTGDGKAELVIGTSNGNVYVVSGSFENTAPSADNQAVTADEDASKTMTLTGGDEDDDIIAFKVMTLPTSGSLYDGPSTAGHKILASELPYTLTLNQATYAPNADFNGADSFGFKTNDGALDSATATVSLTVVPVNDAPSASSQSVTTTEDTPKTIALSGTDVDGDTLSFEVLTLPAGGALHDGSSTGAPVITTVPYAPASNNVTYAPNANTSGPDAFTFKAEDGSTTSANTGTVSITVTAGNDAPVANAQSVSLAEDASTVITLTGSDADGNPFTFKVTQLPGSGKLYNGPTTGSPQITSVPFTTATNIVTYAPNANFNGADAFQFRTNDGAVDSAAATVSVTVTPVNDPPSAQAQSVSVTTGQSTTVTLAGTDVDGSPLSFKVATLPANGTLYDGATTGSPQITTAPYSLATNKVTYKPTTGYTGSDAFDFVASDGLADSTAATVSITVVPGDTTPPDPPVIGSPSNGSLKPKSFPISGTAEANSTVRIYRDGQTSPFATTTAGSGGTWSITVSNVPNGSHTIQATATDAAPNPSGYSNLVTFEVDTVNPTVSISTPTNGQVYLPASPIIVTGSAGDTRSLSYIQLRYRNTMTGNTIVRLVNATCAGGCTGTGTKSWSDSPTLPAGTYDLIATAYDLAGNYAGTPLVGFIVIGI